MSHNKAKHYYGFYVPVDQMISKQYWVSVGPGSVGPRKPKTEHHCFKMPPTHPTADSQGPNMAKWPIWGQVFLEPRDSPSGVSSPWHPPRKGNNQCTLFIGDFSSSSYPPTYVGISIAIYRLLYFIFLVILSKQR